MLKLRHLLLLIPLFSAPAYGFVLWYTALPPLTEADLAAIREAGQGIENQPAGTQRSWQNPDSGHSGQLTFIRTFQNNGRTCRVIRHRIEAGFQQAWSDEVSTCLHDDGRWMLHNQSPTE